MKMEVRCCCDARLIGWLDVSNEVVLGDRLKIALGQVASLSSHDRNTRSIELEVARICEGRRHRSLALRSQEIPLALLRRAPGFVALEDVTPKVLDVGQMWRDRRSGHRWRVSFKDAANFYLSECDERGVMYTQSEVAPTGARATAGHGREVVPLHFIANTRTHHERFEFVGMVPEEN